MLPELGRSAQPQQSPDRQELRLTQKNAGDQQEHILHRTIHLPSERRPTKKAEACQWESQGEWNGMGARLLRLLSLSRVPSGWVGLRESVCLCVYVCACVCVCSVFGLSFFLFCCCCCF